VQTIVDNYNVASTGQAEWYPVAFFVRDDNGEVLGGLLGGERLTKGEPKSEKDSSAILQHFQGARQHFEALGARRRTG
jgi:hypothetical protein